MKGNFFMVKNGLGYGIIMAYKMKDLKLKTEQEKEKNMMKMKIWYLKGYM